MFWNQLNDKVHKNKDTTKTCSSQNKLEFSSRTRAVRSNKKQQGVRLNIVALPQINLPLLSENRRQSQRTVSGNMITVSQWYCVFNSWFRFYLSSLTFLLVCGCENRRAWNSLVVPRLKSSFRLNLSCAMSQKIQTTIYCALRPSRHNVSVTCPPHDTCTFGGSTNPLARNLRGNTV